MTPVLAPRLSLSSISLSRNVSLRSRKRMDLVTIMRGRSSPSTRGCTMGDVTDVIFFLPVSRKPAGRHGAGRRRSKEEEGREGRENNLKAELNFSSSESFVRALGGGQWLNGDVSRKVDSRERPALYRPSIHPLLLALHPHESADARARSPISSRKNIYTREKRERDGEKAAGSVGVAQQSIANNYESIPTIHVVLIPITRGWPALEHIPP